METRRLRTARRINELVLVLLGLGIVIAINIFFVLYVPYRIDVTSTGEFSLAPKTLKILDQIQEKGTPVRVTVFFRPVNNASEDAVKNRRTMDLLEEYRLRSGRMIEAARVVDPDQQPEEVSRLGVRTIGTIVFEMDAKNEDGSATVRRQQVYPKDIWNLRIVEGKPGPLEFRAENGFTKALIALLSDKRLLIDFVSGHQELSIDSKEETGLGEVKQLLEKHNVLARTTNLIRSKGILYNTDAVVLAGPRSTLLPEEDALLTAYAKAGGRLLVLAEFNSKPGLKNLFGYLGVELGDNLVLDPRFSVPGQPMTILPQYGDHEIVRDMKAAKFETVLRTARSVERALGDTRGIQQTDLLRSTGESWAESDYLVASGSRKDVRYDEGTRDLKGPITVGMAIAREADLSLPATSPTPMPRLQPEASTQLGTLEPGRLAATENRLRSPETRAVVIGDSDFVTSEAMKFGANSDLFLNSLLWLVGREEDISITPKDPVLNFVQMTNRQIWVSFGIVVVLLPGVVAAIGLGIWWQRRSL